MLDMNISLDSFCYSNTFGKTYRKFMIPICKLMRGNLDTIFDLNKIHLLKQVKGFMASTTLPET